LTQLHPNNFVLKMDNYFIIIIIECFNFDALHFCQEYLYY